MKSLATKFTAILCCLLMSASGTSFAQLDPAVQDAINSMRDNVRALESRIKQLESTGQATYIPTGEEPGGFLQSMQDIQVGGYVDVQYNQNLTRGGNAIAGGNQGRIFDTDRESFTVNAAELNFTKEANPEGGAGFRVDLAFGEDTGVVLADGLGGDSVDLQQAYVEYVQPLSFWEGNEILPDSINFKAGRFATLAGLEVIEGIDNWNISRSFAFGLTIPFTHTGVRSNFQMFNDFLDVYLGVNNGWDLAVDNNRDKTLEAGLGYSPLENVSVFHALYWGHEGAEAGPASGGSRFLLTNVLTFDATDRLSFMGEVNIGNQERGLPTTDTQWQSYAAYARYQATDKFALAGRVELLHDQQSTRSGLSTLDAGTRNLWEYTLTAEYALAENLISRLELRYDKANNADVFGEDSHQTTIAAQMLYLIG